MKTLISTYILLLLFTLSAEEKYYIVKFSTTEISSRGLYEKYYYSHPTKINTDEYTVEDVKLALRYKADKVVGKKEVFVVCEADTLSEVKREIKNEKGYKDKKNIVLKIGSRDLKKAKETNKRLRNRN